MTNFFLHIYHEEMPIEQQCEASYNKLLNAIISELEYFGISMSKNDIILKYSYIRTVFQFQLPKTSLIKAKKIKGPKISANIDAIKGFAKKQNVTLENLTQQGDYYYFISKEQEINIDEHISQITANILICLGNAHSIGFNWGSFFKWPRPVRQITAIFDNKLIQFHNKVINFRMSKDVIGNKFEFPLQYKEAMSVKDLDSLMQDSNIILNDISPQAKHNIKINITNYVAKVQNGIPINAQQERIITKVASISESPYPILQEIESTSIPVNILTAIMQDHLSFVPIFHNNIFNGQFVSFVERKTLTNSEIESIKHGNTMVLDARIKDAEYFYKQDLVKDIAYFEQQLTSITFHPSLGSISHSVQRAALLAEILNNTLKLSLNLANTKDFIKKSKLDLASGIIGEFPELQGIMNDLYFNSQRSILFKEASIYQYKTLQACKNDNISQDAIKIFLIIWLEYCLSLLFVGEEPTSSRDPFGIRRRLKYIFEITEEILQINDFENHLDSIINQYQKIIHIKKDNVLQNCLKHKV